MEVVIVVLVVIGVLFAVASGVWVAIALISAISGHRAAPRQANERDAAHLDSVLRQAPPRRAAKPRHARREPKK